MAVVVARWRRSGRETPAVGSTRVRDGPAGGVDDLVEVVGHGRACRRIASSLPPTVGDRGEVAGVAS